MTWSAERMFDKSPRMDDLRSLVTRGERTRPSVVMAQPGAALEAAGVSRDEFVALTDLALACARRLEAGDGSCAS